MSLWLLLLILYMDVVVDVCWMVLPFISLRTVVVTVCRRSCGRCLWSLPLPLLSFAVIRYAATQQYHCPLSLLFRPSDRSVLSCLWLWLCLWLVLWFVVVVVWCVVVSHKNGCVLSFFFFSHYSLSLSLSYISVLLSLFTVLAHCYCFRFREKINRTIDISQPSLSSTYQLYCTTVLYCMCCTVVVQRTSIKKSASNIKSHSTHTMPI